jgi:hypothetical protein
MRAWERMILTRSTETQMRIRKETNIMNSVGMQNTKVKKGTVSTYITIIMLKLNYIKSSS